MRIIPGSPPARGCNLSGLAVAPAQWPKHLHGFARLASIALIAGVAGCGGGDSADAGLPLVCASCPPEAPAGSGTPGSVEGYWLGQSGTYEFGAVVLPNGTTFVAYTRAGVVEGFMVGKASASASQFAGSVVDYNAPARAVTGGTLAGDYRRASTMTATARVGSTVHAFTASYDQTYLTEVDLKTLAGTWAGTGASKDGFTGGRLQIAADGTFSGSTPLCSVVGTMKPVMAGKHPLETVAAFSGASCPLGGMTITGIAVVSEASGRRQILTAGIAADGSDGFFGLLTRQ